MGFFKKFTRGLKKSVSKMVEDVGGGIIDIGGELAGGVIGKDAEKIIKGGGRAALGGSLALVSAGTVGGDMAKKGAGQVGSMFSKEEQTLLSAAPATLSAEQLRVRASLEERQRQMKGKSGRASTLLTSQRAAQSGGADTVLTTGAGSSILGR